jgi:hypothetical protein
MRAHNYFKKIPLYRNTNKNLTDEEIGTLLLIDNIYLEIPKDAKEFRSKYPHFDPSIINSETDGINFIEIAKSKDSKNKSKKKLNEYLNVKFNYIGENKSYEENKTKFKEYSKIVSYIIDDLLKKAKFSDEIIKLLGEKEELRNCDDIYEMLVLYKNHSDKRTRFAILRKIGLIVMLARINRTYSMQDLDFAVKTIKDAFFKNLYKKYDKEKTYYFWADEFYKLHFSKSEKDAKDQYVKSCERRKKLASEIYDMQIFNAKPFITKQKNKIIHFEIRNKFIRYNKLNYSSIIEKMIRKNLEFPNQMHDIIGLKIVVNESEDIPKIIDELETFLGGSSTRKKEKNSFNKFGKKLLNKHTFGEYTVWKAIYDIPLPHPSINKVKEVMRITKDNPQAQEFLKKRIAYFINNPRDFVVEVQIQDLKSYLLSIAKGSIPHHDNLKMTQIKENTFYKLFPMEVYKEELWELKKKILNTINNKNNVNYITNDNKIIIRNNKNNQKKK